MIKAIGDRIVLIPEPIQDNIGGIYIPDTSLKKPMRGKVVSVGEDCKEVKVGYEIIFLEGHGVMIEDKLIITEKDVLGYNCINDIKENDDIYDLLAKHLGITLLNLPANIWKDEFGSTYYLTKYGFKINNINEDV